MNPLSVASEDYLERIWELLTEKGYARVSDMADKLSIKPASVTKMVQKLEQLGYIKREPYRGFTLTALGQRVGKKISRRHVILKEFLTLLGVPTKVMQKDIEGLEHHLSAESVKGLERMISLWPKKRRIV
ncbi:MAG: transcriptional regulator MntR [Patescibacteria group bacterium]